jgi:hypothetical protein
MSSKTIFSTTRTNRAIAVLVVIGLSSWLSCQAQVLKGSQPGATNLPAVRLHERLRGVLQGRTSPQIANPAASQHDNSSIIVVCKNQKQAADREVQEMQASFRAMGDGSVRKAGSSNAISGNLPAVNPGTKSTGQPPPGDKTTTGGSARAISGNSTISGNKTISGNGAQQTEMRKAGGDGGVPQQPMKTESASGTQGSGGATANVAMCQPTINTISGFPTVVFSPSPLFNPYTIKGCGFGYQMGNVYLTGPFNAGKIKLQVQTTGGSQKTPARASWSDTSIIVTVDPQLSGEVLLQNVTLVIEPAGSSPIQKAGNKFLPEYADVPLQTIPKSAVKFSQQVGSSSSKDRVLSPALSLTTTDLLYYSPSQVPQGMTAEVFRGGSGTSFFPAATDYYDFSGLAQPFFVVGMQLHQEADPTGCAPDTAGAEGSWSAQWDTKGNIRVTWKEWRCHLAFMGPNDPDVWSDYALGVTVNGPRGIDPWTGRPPLALSQRRVLAPH